jgi:type II secretory pathway pseudopilin PulG
VTLRTADDGFSLIDMIFVCGMIGILATIAVPRLLTAKNSASAASAIATMRTISTAQLSYAISCGNGFYAPDLPSLAKPPVASNTGFVPRDLGSAVTVAKSGYNITMEGLPVAGAPDTCNALGIDNAARAYRAGADPMDPVIGRYFATNALSVIYEDTATLYAAMPESAPPASGHPVR